MLTSVTDDTHKAIHNLDKIDKKNKTRKNVALQKNGNYDRKRNNFIWVSMSIIIYICSLVGIFHKIYLVKCIIFNFKCNYINILWKWNSY